LTRNQSTQPAKRRRCSLLRRFFLPRRCNRVEIACRVWGCACQLITVFDEILLTPLQQFVEEIFFGSVEVDCSSSLSILLFSSF
jgi:hypothetical protein